MEALETRQPVREVIRRTKGHTSGPIARLMSPSDLGELIKPFVFLDLAVFEDEQRIPMERLWHPHSGIATVTVMLDGAVRIAETTGTNVLLPEGGIEWMRAGNGEWHTGQAAAGRVKAFQLWVALPPELENGPSASHYVMPDEVPTDGRVRVILGAHQRMTSPIAAPPAMNYLVVNLSDGERWTYAPPKGHDVAFAAVGDGRLRTPSPIQNGEIVIFAEGSEPIEFKAYGAARFVVGSARKHPHALVLGDYSVHTSARALRQAEAEVRRIGGQLRADGTLGC